ncbi:MAG: DUF4388 domain-containing protein [Thermodesulfovibrionales bacterium]|jgi:tetratricopeptide (TPR) repeat protein
MNMSLKGNLRDHSLPRILLDIKRKGVTGTLSLMSSSVERTIYFRNGEAIFASSTSDADRLGEMLLKAGKITVQGYEKSIELLKRTGQRYGAILVELGCLTPKDLLWGVKYQVAEILYSCFRLDEGATYELQEAVSPSLDITLTLSTEALVYEGIKRLREQGEMGKDMPDLDMVFKLDDDRAHLLRGEGAVVDLDAEDRRIFSLVDGERTVRQVIEEAHASPFETMKTLYGLAVVGVIVKREAPRGENGETRDSRATAGDEPRGQGDKNPSTSEVDSALARRVDDFYQRAKDMGPDEILQVDEKTGPEEIKRNYYRLVREFHPDRVYHTDDKELKGKVTVLFDTITKAYRLFQDEEKRREYFDSLLRPSKPPSWKQSQQSPDNATRETLLTEMFQRGVQEFKKGNFWGAADLFKRVTKEDPRNTKAWSYLSLALSKVPNRLKESEEALLKAVALDPLNSEHLTNLGLIYLKAGLNMRARKQFEKALKLDPANKQAKQGLEQIG